MVQALLRSVFLDPGVDGTPTAANPWVEGTVEYAQVFASDGRLTISNAAGSVNNKIAFIEIQQTGVGR